MATFYTHNGDLDLAKRLGLDTSLQFPHAEWVELGTYEHRWAGDKDVAYRVRVSVNAMPAQFWRFNIVPITTDGQFLEVSTGSGGLSDYWPTIKNMAEGMITVTPARRKY